MGNLTKKAPFVGLNMWRRKNGWRRNFSGCGRLTFPFCHQHKCFWNFFPTRDNTVLWPSTRVRSFLNGFLTTFPFLNYPYSLYPAVLQPCVLEISLHAPPSDVNNADIWLTENNLILGKYYFCFTSCLKSIKTTFNESEKLNVFKTIKRYLRISLSFCILIEH